MTGKRCAVLLPGNCADHSPEKPLSACCCCCRWRTTVMSDEQRNASRPKHGATIQLARTIAIKHINNPGVYESITAAARAEGWPEDGDKSALHRAHREMRNALRQVDTPSSTVSPPVASAATVARATEEPTPSGTTTHTTVNANTIVGADGGQPSASLVGTSDVEAATDSTAPESPASVRDGSFSLASQTVLINVM